MKLRTWLLLSYFLVMILPLVTAYFLFAWVNAYYQDQKVAEYIHTRTELQDIVSVLDDPDLYQPDRARPQVEQIISPQISIVLYNRDGIILYTSDPALNSSPYTLSKELLYKDLFALKQGYRAYTYKAPVHDGNDLVGFFEVHLARNEWVSGVADRSWLTAGLFVVAFGLIYLLVACFVHRKLNRRLNRLMKQMTAFARGEEIVEMPVDNDEIGALTKHFYAMRRQIESAREKIAKEQQEKEYMIATISHDLKTPLTSIRAYAESLASEQELSTKERNEYRKIIVEKAKYMKQMLDDLLMYTLLQSPQYAMEIVEVEGSEFFEMLVSDYEALCAEKNVSLHVHCDVSGNVRVNPKQMVRVADNLMSNAISHTQPGDQIWLAAVSEDRSLPRGLFPFVKEQFSFDTPDSVFLIVQNEGEGIAQEEAGRVFDPLYQVDQARSKKNARGTGLGLSITQQIIDKHGGDVRILSKEGLGTCIVCRIPKTDKEGEDREIR